MAKDQQLGAVPPKDPAPTQPPISGINEQPIAPQPETGFNVPGSGSVPQGISGQPPVAVGGVISGSLTPAERQALEQAGLNPDTDTIPKNVAQVLQATAAQQKAEDAEFQSPVPPNTPPVSLEDAEILDMATLDPDERKRYREALAGNPDDAAAAKPFTPPTPEQLEAYSQQSTDSASAARGVAPPAGSKPQETFVTPTPEVSPAKKAIAAQLEAQKREQADGQMYANMDPTVAQAHQQLEGGMMDKIQIDDDRDQATYSDTGKAKESAESQEGDNANKSHTGVDAELSNCPHCQWPLAVPDPTEPDQEEKDVFIAAQLGRQPYVKTYATFGGRSRVTFRTLTTLEMDEIHRQVAYEVKSGQLLVMDDFFERVNRYRLYLQIAKIETAGQELITQPSGWSKQTAPKADSHYTVREAELNEGETYLPQLELFMLGELLATESLIRSYGNIHAMFGRLTAKMEAMVDNSDFWNETETQP